MTSDVWTTGSPGPWPTNHEPATADGVMYDEFFDDYTAECERCGYLVSGFSTERGALDAIEEHWASHFLDTDDYDAEDDVR